MDAQAKLLEHREFNLISVWPRLTMKSKDEFDEYLRCHADRRKVFPLSYVYSNNMGTIEDMASVEEHLVSRCADRIPHI
ncbi:unnamed protein product [Nippostrongylus brasiliensis]|uniref:ALO domain-containing protein n=1 Tax=Nippostrongylus brasiliensis TaxID=27835 RepID=A0A0N4YEA1_NIPBR|nr:unnamed protein product [Nippostrongylus brasiliensis]